MRMKDNKILRIPVATSSSKWLTLRDHFTSQKARVVKSWWRI